MNLHNFSLQSLYEESIELTIFYPTILGLIVILSTITLSFQSRIKSKINYKPSPVSNKHGFILAHLLQYALVFTTIVFISIKTSPIKIVYMLDLLIIIGYSARNRLFVLKYNTSHNIFMICLLFIHGIYFSVMRINFFYEYIENYTT